MRVELPEGYVPPEPTHPLYGYLTPEEQEAFEAEERARLGIVPGVMEGAEVEESEEAEEPASSWAPVAAAEAAPAPTTLTTLAALTEPVSEAEEATVAHTGWVPQPPPEPGESEPVAAEPAVWGPLASTGGTRTGRSGLRRPSRHRPPRRRRRSRSRTSPPRPAAEGHRARGRRRTGSGCAGTRERSAGSPSRPSRRTSGLARGRAMQHTGPRARVAEWQTRWLQVPVPARAWGFKSPLAHRSRRFFGPGWTVRPLSSSRSSRTAANSVMCGVPRWASSCSAVSQFS